MSGGYILGCDISPEYQPRFDVTRAAAEGMRFIAVKLSDGSKGTERYEDGIRVCRQAATLGMVVLGYAFLYAPDPASGIPDEAGQAAAFVDQLRRAGNIPGMIDWESTATSSPTIDNLREMTGEMWARGARLPFTYAPRWYWQRQGSPSLAGLPPLWASHFVVKDGLQVAGMPGDLVKLVDPAWWDGYGGKPARMLQFTSKAAVAGVPAMDADVYLGSSAELFREVWGL